MSISTRKVEDEGPVDAKIMCVGEAPGEWEDRLCRPFVSRDVAKQAGFTLDTYQNTAGELLERYLGRLGVNRSSIYLTNLCKYRPPNNSFNSLLDSSQLASGIDELGDTIDKVNPNVIIALGAWPTWFLAGKCGKDPKTKKPKPGTGIGTYRGSRYPSLLGRNKRKVICTYHPAGVLRNWKTNPIFYLDLQHAIEDSKFPELAYPKYEEFIDPPSDVCYDLVSEALGSPWISLDIETFPSRKFSCIGASWRRNGIDRALCITFYRPELHHFCREIWESSIPKIMQYGTYDISFMKTFYNWKIGGYYDSIGWDTYIASASLLPDYDRGLDFLTSIFTRFPFYKHERKIWKEKDDMNILWRYNIKDCVATYTIAMEQMNGIKELFKQA